MPFIFYKGAISMSSDLSDQIKKMRSTGLVARVEDRRATYRDFVVGSEKKSPLGRPRCRRENTKKDLQEVGCGGMDWIDVAQDSDRWWAVANAVMYLPVSIKCGAFLTS